MYKLMFFLVYIYMFKIIHVSLGESRTNNFFIFATVWVTFRRKRQKTQVTNEERHGLPQALRLLPAVAFGSPGWAMEIHRVNCRRGFPRDDLGI